jgi:hypothetical protein
MDSGGSSGRLRDEHGFLPPMAMYFRAIPKTMVHDAGVRHGQKCVALWKNAVRQIESNAHRKLLPGPSISSNPPVAWGALRRRATLALIPAPRSFARRPVKRSPVTANPTMNPSRQSCGAGMTVPKAMPAVGSASRTLTTAPS